ncbi:T9SS type A sorting domain-containing protein [Prevotella nanceiensis]|uniref:LamG-like jellyroll fold domain-containing protein n=1 Tax=Hoylesella nanceiensis TaxID=425941 RepID=UPI001C5F4D88|nr:LamG-like jellyroll fold domain-containing protein [Hoylesella nanceiensis]MBW4766455.1 T9SS type A sorting domain-containing protein [Hoylesella nanceiensis]
MASKKLQLLMLGCLVSPAILQAQSLKEEYIQWHNSKGDKLSASVDVWGRNGKVTNDDNFFISRVKPKQRFRNEKTQVLKDLTAANDKRLVAWIPFNNPKTNALPDGIFDSEVFSLWSYVSHWGDWTAPLGRIPAALMDVAHKNGVAVSSLAGVPWQNMGEDWNRELRAIGLLDGQKLANYLYYYGQDGLGYNSEWSEWNRITQKLREKHVEVNKLLKDKNPIFENMWYGLTQDNGRNGYSNALDNNYQLTFGDSENKAFSLFLNYNWNLRQRLSNSVDYAKTMGRDPLYLYAGVNMQGGEPRSNSWPLLKDYPISIGLWGAHEKNMFWESRNEKGSSEEAMQRSYMLRTERYFTGGTRNPANTPEVTDAMKYNVDNTNWHGMSTWMSAKSTLSWNLTDEPFISYFNLGNGKFFNWMGERKNNNPWYNVGVQDYLPTWRWWFSTDLLGRNVPARGLDAEFTWDDAYVGGSCVRVFGSNANEYLHLFKTEYALQTGDVITFKYKHLNGSGDVKLVLTAKGSETSPINENSFELIKNGQEIDDEHWTTKTFTVGSELAGKELALIALHFENANNINMYLGECSIVRGTARTPNKPTITSSDLLAFSKSGVDGKLIFDMPNTKAGNEPCYNSDVHVSLFKLWAQQEGATEPTLMGITTSWAGMFYSIPLDLTATSTKVRLGVSAVSLDMKNESPIEWTDYKETPAYTYNDAVHCNKTIIKPNEEFKVGYVDPRHSEGNWELKKADGTTVFSSNNTKEFTTSALTEVGNYDLVVTGDVHSESGTTTQTRTFKAFVQITGEATGALPQIQTLTANGSTATINVQANEAVTMAYTGRPADGQLSRGVNLKEKGFVFKATEVGLESNNQAWTMSFWLKFNSLPSGSVQILDLRNQYTTWPQNNWGSIWSEYSPTNKVYTFTIRENRNGGSPEHKQNWSVEFEPGVWSHVTITMEKTERGVKEHLYINGKPATAKDWSFLGNGTGYIQDYVNTTTWWGENHFMLGFGRAGQAAIDGVIDDVKFFDKQLTDAEVAANMLSNDKNAANLKAFWNFEENADAQNKFASVATGTNVKAYRSELAAGANEGQGSLSPVEPLYEAGSPFISGTAFSVETKATWKTRKGTFSDETGNDRQGSAKVTYPTGGDYTVTLTLENSYGKDQRTFQVIHIDATTGINETTTEEVKAYTVNDDILVDCAQAGAYTFEVYSIDGMQVLKNNVNVATGNTVRLHLANSGVYILKVKKEGKTLRTVKLIRK